MPSTLDRLLTAIRAARQPLSFLFGASLLVLLSAVAYRNWQQLPADFLSSVHLPLAVAALGLVFVSYFFISLEWHLTLRALGARHPWRVTAKVWFLSLAMRYLPGGIWTYVGRAYMGVQREMNRGVVVASLMMEAAFRVASELIVFTLSLWFWQDLGPWSLWAPVVSVLSIIGAVALGAILTNRRCRSLLARMRWFTESGWPTLSPTAYWALLAYYVAAVLLACFALSGLARAIYPLANDQIPVFMGLLALSSTVGFVFPLAPNGWGVREGTLVALLGLLGVPAAAGFIIALGSRLWLFMGELLWMGIALLL
jgi:glycosyltransferase 2 family protein